MITTTILTIFLSLIMGIFGILPDLPPIPIEIENITNTLIDFVGNMTSVLALIFTQALLSAAVLVILSIFLFSNAYHLTMWVLRKIPMLNVK